MWKRVISITAIAIGLVGLVVGGLSFYVNYPDRNMLDVSEVYRAKTDIAGIENALRAFHERNGRYPRTLAEVTRTSGGIADNEPWLISLPVNPWGGAYQYRVQVGPTGENYKIWAVPDLQTQTAMELAEVSNTTELPER